MEKKDRQIGIRCSHDIFVKIQAIANRENRTVSNLILTLIFREIESNNLKEQAQLNSKGFDVV